MQEKTLLDLLDAQIRRCVQKLDEVEPDDERYRVVLGNLGSLFGVRYAIADVPERNVEVTVIGTETEEMDTSSAAEAAPSPQGEGEEPEGESGTTPATAGEPVMELTDVRARLADLRKKGVNVAELIRSFGAKYLTELDPALYGKLLAAAEKEAGA